MKALIQLQSDLGPAVLVDQHNLVRLRSIDARTFFSGGLEQEAENGTCCWLRFEGIRQFAGTVELRVDEPEVTPAQAVVSSRSGLLLHVPTGKLLIDAAGSMRGESPGELPQVLELPPGDYLADVSAYETPEEKLEREDSRTPANGEVLPGIFGAVGCLFALITAVLLVSIAVLATRGEWDATRWPLIGIALLWVPFAIAFKLLGVGAKVKSARNAEEMELAQLPREPDFRVVLRRLAALPEGVAGGGLAR